MIGNRQWFSIGILRMNQSHMTPPLPDKNITNTKKTLHRFPAGNDGEYCHHFKS